MAAPSLVLDSLSDGMPCVPGTRVGLFGKPDKMRYQRNADSPALSITYSWSLPAGRSCPGAVYGPGSVCGGCYAQKNRYRMPNVEHALRARWAWTLRCLGTPAGRDEWVAVMTEGLRWATRLHVYFRGHDSGDFFSPRYAELWLEVCQALPQVRFWFPTRSYHQTPRILAVLERLAALPNVTIRPSALQIDEAPPRIPGLSAGTGVVREGFTCPASLQGNRCRTCRVCWNADQEVQYHLH